MYINVYTLFCVLLGILGVVALIFLIILLKRMCNFMYKVNKFLDSNSKNISSVTEELPKVVKNAGEMTENFNMVSEAAVEVTSSIIDKKENMASDFKILTEVLKIILNMFKK
ncbi:hypothetical protein [Clostridium felsineum]|uniref:Uncharacterized protein n=1 Tax=Clostridium felsineum TaxID=36839 RepID=A0A1S8LFX0_9CLOT|nr:hypothetical protein [Clostridium felsineum]URZ00477.1 hypothetical protein CLAUR_004650 [Clostridium felsineum]URZ06884.1 hypothetical protein CLROS_022170 [Clostridium felsineum]URZ11916.1 hypothetical protein CROST_026330 [Clostridium felsineum]URZ16451.1 hypothetical protein CLFE_024980 [Clostridium felsineum DSM 794]